MLRTIQWREGVVETIDQTRLPHETVILRLTQPKEIAEAIKTLAIRGAPLIGAAAALALAQTAYYSKARTKSKLLNELGLTSELIRKTRPTAVNLFNAMENIILYTNQRSHENINIDALRNAVIDKCLAFVEEDVAMSRGIGRLGAQLLEDGDTVLTHCNAGALATVEGGTALAVIRAAKSSGKTIHVIATETRPLLQGARLTTYELLQEGIPVTLIVDSAVGVTMAKGMVKKVIVGADRILIKGHVINKVGTYSIATLAKRHGIPFYVAAPTTTLDGLRKPGEVILEERSPLEVTSFHGRRIAPKGVDVFNPAFDITPPDLVSAIITEKGVFTPPFKELSKLVDKH